MPSFNPAVVVRLALLALAIVLLVVFLGQANPGDATGPTRIPYSQMLEHIRAKEVRMATYDAVTGELTATMDPGAAADGSSSLDDPGALLQVVTTLPPSDNETLKTLAGSASLTVLDRPRPSAWSAWALALVPILLLVALFWWMMRRQSGQGGNPVLGFGKSKLQALVPADNPVRLADVAGCDEAKAEVAEIIEFLKSPERYTRVGGRMPHGILLSGPPGTGKTLLAKAIAGEAGVPFFFTSGAEFVEMFVGVGASRVRDAFAQAKAHAPSIVFIDELDAIGGKRSQGGPGSGGNDEREQTLNQLLVEMNGFKGNEGVIVIAATNRPDMLDEALRRPGRFDREVVVGLPDRAGRVDILKVHAKGVAVDVSVDWDHVARGTPGFSGADLANLVNEAALAAARKGQVMVSGADLEWARDRIVMGAEKLGGMKNERERKITAYHEAGHALVARFIEGSDPVHKITIVPRGRALGLTMQLPREDAYNSERGELLGRVAILMGGRAAEEVALGVRTAGAGNDFARASQIVRRMVSTWGMDDELGPISVDSEYGAHPGLDNGWSEGWKRQVDDKVAQVLREQYQRACDILRANTAVLEEVGQALLEMETLDADQFEKIVLNHLPSVVPPVPATNPA